jgi:PhnB protein
MAFKPDGYNSVSPYLIVNGAQATIDFIVAVFGARPLRAIPRENGTLQHGEVRMDDTVLMVTDAIDGWPAVPAHVHVYVADVDAIFARALKFGALAVQEPVRKDDADKRGGFQDAGGTTWWAGQQVK